MKVPNAPPVKTQVFIIAFPDQALRDTIRQRLNPAGIFPRFIDAIRGSTVPESERLPFLESGREYWFDGPMREGAMGCSLSHFRAWQTMLDENLDAAVVLEDDAAVIPSSQDIIVERLNALHDRCEDLDLVFLHRRYDRKDVRIDGSLENEPGLSLTRYKDMGAESYFISASCARYLLSRPERYLFEVDLFLQHWWRHYPNIHVLHHSPPLFREVGRPSQINHEPQPRYSSSTLLQQFSRRRNRVLESFQKRWHFGAYSSAVRKRFIE